MTATVDQFLHGVNLRKNGRTADVWKAYSKFIRTLASGKNILPAEIGEFDQVVEALGKDGTGIRADIAAVHREAELLKGADPDKAHAEAVAAENALNAIMEETGAEIARIEARRLAALEAMNTALAASAVASSTRNNLVEHRRTYRRELGIPRKMSPLALVKVRPVKVEITDAVGNTVINQTFEIIGEKPGPGIETANIEIVLRHLPDLYDNELVKVPGQTEEEFAEDCSRIRDAYKLAGRESFLPAM